MPDQASETTIPRGDETRALLLNTALQLFAVHGFDSVTTRQLAKEAGVNIAAIAYHFGGKRELYRAVLTQLVDDTEPHIGETIRDVGGRIDDAKGDPQQLTAIVVNLTQNLISLFLGAEFMRWRGPLVIREYALPSEDFEIIYRGRIEPMHKLLTALVAAILNLPSDAPECAIRAHTFMGQLFVFGIARTVLWQRLDWDSYTPERVALVTETVTQSILASLGLQEGMKK